MQGSGGVYAGLTGHNFHIAQTRKKEKHIFMGDPLYKIIREVSELFKNITFHPQRTRKGAVE